MKAKDLMTSPAVVVSAEATVEEAAAKMKEADVGALPVYGGAGGPWGIITDRDIAVRAVAVGRGSATQVGEVCTLPVITVEPDADIDDVAYLMKKHQLRRLPVLQDDVVEGMISLADIALAQERLVAEVLSAVCRPPVGAAPRGGSQ
ncbi:MAG: CBS domain-containing protein [Chloroflexi bacterium]|nr:CBS domain-containing protein [Chloroflexota bacterium]